MGLKEHSKYIIGAVYIIAGLTKKVLSKQLPIGCRYQNHQMRTEIYCDLITNKNILLEVYYDETVSVQRVFESKAHADFYKRIQPDPSDGSSNLQWSELLYQQRNPVG